MTDYLTLPWHNFTTALSPSDRISQNFKMYELTKSEVAARRGIDNSIKRSDYLQNAVYLCRNILQPIRDKFGRLSPNSVYRSQALERALKDKPSTWRSYSQHTKGQACDVEIIGKSTLSLARWVRQNLEFDQLICECYNPAEGPNSGWVHVSIAPPGRGDNRRDVKSYVKNPATGKYGFVPGLAGSLD